MRNLRVIDDTRLWHVDRADALRVRLQLPETLRTDERTIDAVGLSSLIDALDRKSVV